MSFFRSPGDVFGLLNQATVSNGAISERGNVTSATQFVMAASCQTAPAGVYDMSFDEGGLCLIFCQEVFDEEKYREKYKKVPKRREGTKEDVKDLFKTFRKLGFKRKNIRMFEDLTYDEIERQLNSVLTEHLSKFSCFVCCVLSHGMDGDICAHDTLYSLNKLFDPFIASKCPGLKDKPKIFFIHACLGSEKDYGCDIRTLAQNDAHEETRTASIADAAKAQKMVNEINYKIFKALPKELDFLVHFSTVPKYKAWRANDGKSWFVQELTTLLQASVMSDIRVDLLSLLTEVNISVALNCEIFEESSEREPVIKKKEVLREQPSVYYTLKRKIYFPRFTGQLNLYEYSNTDANGSGDGEIDSEPEMETDESAIITSEAPALNIAAASPVYDESRKRRGLCAIFSHNHFDKSLHRVIPKKVQQRKWNKMDTDTLNNAFSALGFDVLKFEDLKHTNIMKKLNEVRDNLSAKDCDYDCFVCCVLTSATFDERLCAYDDTYGAEELYEPFYGNKCGSLRGRPKLFFIQSCFKNRSIEHDGDNDQYDSQTIPITSDILVYHSYIAGHHTWDIKSQPSLFVQSLTKVLNEFLEPDNREDLVSLLTTANEDVAKSFSNITAEGREKHTYVYHTLNRKVLFPWKE